MMTKADIHTFHVDRGDAQITMYAVEYEKPLTEAAVKEIIDAHRDRIRNLFAEVKEQHDVDAIIGAIPDDEGN